MYRIRTMEEVEDLLHQYRVPRPVLRRLEDMIHDAREARPRDDRPRDSGSQYQTRPPRGYEQTLKARGQVIQETQTLLSKSKRENRELQRDLTWNKSHINRLEANNDSLKDELRAIGANDYLPLICKIGTSVVRDQGHKLRDAQLQITALQEQVHDTEALMEILRGRLEVGCQLIHQKDLTISDMTAQVAMLRLSPGPMTPSSTISTELHEQTPTNEQQAFRALVLVRALRGDVEDRERQIEDHQRQIETLLAKEAVYKSEASGLKTKLSDAEAKLTNLERESEKQAMINTNAVDEKIHLAGGM